MFDNCNTLLELNAARTKACTVEGADIIAINNAYNERRQLILQKSATTYRKIEFRPIIVEKGVPFAALPIIGVSSKPGTIELAERGFLL